VIYNNDDYLYKLNRPLMMAANDDEDDEIFNEEEPNGEEPNGEEPNGEHGPSADDNGDDPVVKGEGTSTRDSKGITRGALSFGALAFTGIIPLVLLILYMIKGAGLSSTAMLFMVAFFIGMVLSVWTFVYYRSGSANFNRFDVHSFFRWPEIAVITVVLLAISFYNLSTMPTGNGIHLSADSTIQGAASATDSIAKSEDEKQPGPIFAPKPPSGNIAENEEVLYETQEFSPANPKARVAKPAARPRVVVPRQKSRVAPVVTPRQRIYRNAAPVVTRPVNTVRNSAPVVIPVVTNSTKTEKPVVNTAADPNGTSMSEPVKAHEDEEGTSTTSGNKMDNMVDKAVGIAETSANNYSEKTTSAAGAPESKKIPVPTEVPTSPLVSSLFLGGVLCAALGYALPLAIAGAILGLFRKFNHPFSAKVKELLNEETGEITLETEAQSTLNKILDHIFRFFIGFNIGGTLGFLLGIVITIPLYFMFWDTAQSSPSLALSNFLTTMGVVKSPDLAYFSGVIVAGIMVPIIMLVVGKGSPAGLSISEETVRQVYSIPVTINKVSTDMTTIPEPAIISFDLEEGEENKDGLIVDEFSEDAKESLTHDLLSEFGVDMESVFGMKVNLPAKTNGDSKISNFEKQKVTSILENSLGELGNVTVQVSAELGKANIMLTDWLNLSEGMLIELDKPVSEEIDILINEVCKGKGKLTVVDNHLSVKVSKSNFSQSKN
jgi:flagellar motor switch protein FliN/FliY